MAGYRLALVTGATSGIGREVCDFFAKKGLDLLISARNAQELERLRESLSRLVSVHAFPADLSTPEGRSVLIEALHQHVPDVVINNAGFGLYGDALSYSSENQSAILKVNGEAVLELSLEAARALISHAKKGVILNVSSAAAFQVFPSMAVYAAVKAFVNQFSQAFDWEVKPYGVRVLTICPGMVATNFQKRAGGDAGIVTAGVMPPSFVAEQIWRQIETLKPLLIVDWKYRFLTWIASLFPISMTAPFNKHMIDSRIRPRTLIKVDK